MPIALVGIGCRLPGGAGDPEAFWRLLVDGVDAITDLPPDRWNPRAFYDPRPGTPGKICQRWGGFVEGIDRFDAAFFGISPREAARMDPQQRMLLEVSWEAMEDAGEPLERMAGSRTGVFVGISSLDYSVLQTRCDPATLDGYSNMGGTLSIAANRISYCFDFRGPSLAVDTACSSALVAFHLACQSLWRGESSVALAGGVNVLLLPEWYIGFSRLSMLSPDGRCKAFDAHGRGFVRSEGAAMVLLKPLTDALAQGDRIYAIVLATGVNQDGRTPGITVPSQEAQEDLLRETCRAAGIRPADIGYVEAHGTGTAVGDPVEARALGNVLSEGRPAGRPCLVGSVKTNIGHLEAGSGIAGLIKAALSLHHCRIPGNLHLEVPNPEIPLESLRLRVPRTAEPWPAGDGPRLAGINSFGFGGTNAHAILQESPAGTNETVPASSSDAARLIPLSARSAESLRAAAGRLAQRVDAAEGSPSLADVCHTASLRRTHHEHRLAVVARSTRELAERLRAFAAPEPSQGTAAGRAEGVRPALGFVCSGQGPQWWAMGRQLLAEEPVFRKRIEECDAIVRRLGPWSLLEELTADETRSRIQRTAVTQPAIFALQAALAALWKSWGVEPAAIVGHSVGEVAAAYLAGVFHLEDAVRVIYHRGRCMELVRGQGRMLAAGLTPEEARQTLAPYGDRVSLAAANAPASVTLSGDPGPLEEIAAELEQRGIFARFLQVDYAFHSRQMEPVRDELLASLGDLVPRPAVLPLISTVTGRAVQGEELDAEYWWKNVRQTVLFAEGVDRLMETGCRTMVELSPHPVLAGSVAECFLHRDLRATIVPSLRRHDEERATMLGSLGQLYTLGYPVAWDAVQSPGRLVRLPTYAWQRERFWNESFESREARVGDAGHPLLGRSRGAASPLWRGTLDLRVQTYLEDHRLQGAAILPATAFLEVALAVARGIGDSGDLVLEDVRLEKTCFLPEGEPVSLETAYRLEDGSFQIHSRSEEKDPVWTAHVRGTLGRLPAQAEPPCFSPGMIRPRCKREISAEECYAAFRRVGLQFGPMFRGVQCVWQGDRESLGVVRVSETLDNTAGDYILHPAVLDACFHVLAVSDPDFGKPGNGLFLPVEIELLRVAGRPGKELWCHGRLRSKSRQQMVADLDIQDEQGRLIAQVRGLRGRRVAGEDDHAVDSLVYVTRWQAQPRPAGATILPPSPEDSASANGWLILADRGGTAHRLAERLTSIGQQPILVLDGPRYEQLAPDCFQVDPSRREDFGRLVGELGRRSRAGLRGIVHLWSLDAPAPEGLTTEALEAAQDKSVAGMTHLLQALGQSEGGVPRLWLVTRGAFCVDAAESPAVAQSPLCGLARVIVHEDSRLRAKTIDLDPGAGADLLGPLWDELSVDDREDEVALRGPQRYVSRYGHGNGVEQAVALRRLRPPKPYRLTVGGGLDGLSLRSLDRRPPGEGEVEIEVVAASLNFSDVLKALDLYPGLPDGPVPLGAECSGRIVAVGRGVDRFQPGDEVLAVAPFALASHVTTAAALTALKPPQASFEEAASIPIAFLTASYALESLGRLSPGERVLIHSATGGVGLAAIQIARRCGAEVFATAGTPEKREHLRSLGVEHVFDSRSLAFADEILQRTGGRGINVVLNSLAGEALAKSMELLSEYGRFLEIGKRDIYQNRRVGLHPFRKSTSFLAIDLDRLIRQQPLLIGSLLQPIVRDLAEGRLAWLPCRVFPVAQAADAFRHLQQARHVGKVAVSMREPPSDVLPCEDRPLVCQANASYLIVGGLGGFGLAVAGWLADRGARHLALVGRRGAASEEAARGVAELEARGVQVLVLSADVSRPGDLAAALAETDRRLPPLRGVIHAAMVLEDAVLANVTIDQIRRVMASKVSGSWNLHRLTQGRELDFFVLFSSLSSVLGNPSQASYAAANAFLDALAHFRRALGLPALAINWGYLGEVGYLAKQESLGRRLIGQGVSPVELRLALASLEKSLAREAVQVGVLNVDWTRWREASLTGWVSPRFDSLCQQHGTGGGTSSNGDGTAAVLEGLSDSRRREALADLLKQKVARVLGAAADRLDMETPLIRLGLDSLMAVDLRNWIERELRINLPIVELMRSPSLASLSGLLADAVAAAAGPSPSSKEVPAVPPPPDAAEAERLLAQVNDLSADQLDALLASMLHDRPQDH